jgi:hypothetical protein
MPLKPQLVEAKLSTVLVGRLDATSFAELVLCLTEGAEAYLATVIWEKRLWERAHRVLVSDARTPLAIRDEDGRAILGVPDPFRLRSLQIMTFFEDGSVLNARLGAGDNVTVTRGDAKSESARRLAAAKTLMVRSGHKRRYYAALFASLLIALLWAATDVLTGYWLVAVFVVALGLIGWGGSGISARVVPRDRRLLRIARMLEWSKSDTKAVIVAIVVGLLMLWLGMAIG